MPIASRRVERLRSTFFLGVRRDTQRTKGETDTGLTPLSLVAIRYHGVSRQTRNATRRVVERLRSTFFLGVRM